MPAELLAELVVETPAADSRFRPYCRPNGWWTVEDQEDDTFLVTKTRRDLEWAIRMAGELDEAGSPGAFTWEKIA